MIHPTGPVGPRSRAGSLTLGALWLAIVPALAGAGPDGISLTVGPSASPGQLTLAWSGGESPYLVYRSDDAAAVVTATTRVATTAQSSVDVPTEASALEYFLVVAVDRTSPVTASSACLTAGTGARAAIVAELRDSLGHALPGLTVTMMASAGTLGAVEDDAGTYRAVLAAPAAASGPITVDVSAESAPLDGAAILAVAEPLIATEGAAGGCPADGNLRVRVVDELGSPLAGARVLLGQAEVLTVYRTSPAGPADAPNTAFSDAGGYVEFLDFGDALAGPQTVTAAAEGRRYVTLLGADVSDVVLPLAPVAPVIQAESFTGDVTNVPAPAGGPIEIAVMLPDVSLDTVLSFSTADLLADAQCYNAGGAAGSVPVPGNVYIPQQCAVVFIVCLQNLPEHEYTSTPVPFGDRRLLALRGSAPLAGLTAGDISQVTLDGIGVVPRTASAAGPTRVDLPITQGLAANLSCTIDHAPLNADVFCVGAGDWDSRNEPDLTPGAGRLFVTGFRLGDATGATGPFAIPGVTTVARTGPFAEIDYLGGAVAQYTDPAKPGIPPGTENGASAILERSGTAFDGTGGTLVFDDFFPIRTLARTGRAFSMSALPGTGHPPADLTRVAIDRVIRETYTACVPDDSARSRQQTLWEIWLPGDTDAWSLPEPPPGWPRQEVGGELAGLVDPAATAEDDRLSFSASTLHLGSLGGGFDFDRLRFADVRLHLTHATRNEVDY